MEIGADRVIRGITAPASLKLGNNPLLLRPCSFLGYPGHNCPGLIEATLAGSSPLADTGYPGHNCPGLIEASKKPRKVSGGRCYPGHNCPGLIEAIATV
ncbi:protein of unknown function [Candidatus Methylocalor cossyra]|uniref:Uncharacterized protein n=1 Tax=Candidatus Methylocalor cossyra TaxID=3108543 RepID=A0ABM9NLE5_9GAMM